MVPAVEWFHLFRLHFQMSGITHRCDPDQVRLDSGADFLQSLYRQTRRNSILFRVQNKQKSNGIFVCCLECTSNFFKCQLNFSRTGYRSAAWTGWSCPAYPSGIAPPEHCPTAHPNQTKEMQYDSDWPDRKKYTLPQRLGILRYLYLSLN